MPEEDKKSTVNVKTIATTVGGVVAIVSSILGLWFMAEDRLRTSIITNTMNITEMIQRSTDELIRLHHDDLMVRKRIVLNDIETRRDNAEKVPRILTFELQALKDQLENLDRRRNE